MHIGYQNDHKQNSKMHIGYQNDHKQNSKHAYWLTKRS